jgi:hypothetical protein
VSPKIQILWKEYTNSTNIKKKIKKIQKSLKHVCINYSEIFITKKYWLHITLFYHWWKQKEVSSQYKRSLKIKTLKQSWKIQRNICETYWRINNLIFKNLYIKIISWRIQSTAHNTMKLSTFELQCFNKTWINTTIVILHANWQLLNLSHFMA